MNALAVMGKSFTSICWGIVTFVHWFFLIHSLPFQPEYFSSEDLDLLKEALIKSAPSWRL
jgi:hypothetical protein